MITAACFVLMIACHTTLADSDSDTADYVIENYDLTFATERDSAAVRVTMDITYLIRSGTKSAGFKYVGKCEAEQLSGASPDGGEVKTWLEHHRETQINWDFRPAGRGRKHIMISFTIPDALAGDLKQNTLEADWAGIFRVPVNRASYRLVMPDGTQRTVQAAQAGLRPVRVNGLMAYELIQSPLTEKSFRVKFSPGIAAGRSVSRSVSEADSGGIGLSAGLGILGVVITMILLIARRARRAGRSGTGSSAVGGSCGGSSGCGGGGCGS